jgi:hypothetical protein
VKAQQFRQRALEKERQQRSQTRRMNRKREQAQRNLNGDCMTELLRTFKQRAENGPLADRAQHAHSHDSILEYRERFLKRDRDRAQFDLPPRLDLTPEERGLPTRKRPSRDS